MVFIFFMVAGCSSKQTPEQQVFDVLEKVVSLENSFVEQQDALVQLEQQEKHVYDQIMGLGMKEYKQLVELSEEAIILIEKRKKHMQKERDSIIASQEEFSSLPSIIKKIGDEKTRAQANELYKIMNERYDAHQAMYENYLKGSQFDIELYQMFKETDLTLEQLENQIRQINDAYEKVLSANEKFNERTENYNELKRAFYEKTGMDMQTK